MVNGTKSRLLRSSSCELRRNNNGTHTI